MAQQLDTVEYYRARFAELESRLNGQTATGLHDLRRRAMERFVETGFPTTRDEEWRYTGIAAVTRQEFLPALEPVADVRAADLEGSLVAGVDGPRLVFVDGHYAPRLSRPSAPDTGVEVADLSTLLQRGAGSVDGDLGRLASFDEEAFTALNTAFLRDGALVRIAPGAVASQAIQVIFASSGSPSPTASFPRLLVAAGAGSRATLIESYVSLGDGPELTSAVAEMDVGEGAHLDHYRIQRQSRATCHFSDLRVSEARDAVFRATCFTLGGGLVRNHVHAALRGEGIDSTLNGLYLTDGEQHVDNHTLIEHASPHGSSHEYYKGVLGGRSTGVFRGRIYVHRAAQKTDAYQANRNLLLSDNAEADTRPQLEIYADDVKCSHGATVGRLDEDAIFYLRSRGVGQERARQMLTRAFAAEIVERVHLEPLRLHLDELVSRRLSELGSQAV